MYEEPGLRFGSDASENINLLANGGRVLFLRDVANVTIGPEIRRGIAELNGEGVRMRFGL